MSASTLTPTILDGSQLARVQQWLGLDDFAVLGLPRQFAQDLAHVDARYKALQRLAHPDRFATQDPAAVRLAVQWSARLNEAVRRLRDPFQRLCYLCALRGAPVQPQENQEKNASAHSNADAMAADFLLEQMQWHERIDDSATATELHEITRALQQRAQTMLEQAGALVDQDAAAASLILRKLMFIHRLSRHAEQKLHSMQHSMQTGTEDCAQ